MFVIGLLVGFVGGVVVMTLAACVLMAGECSRREGRS